jgi:hypothetical protein
MRSQKTAEKGQGKTAQAATQITKMMSMQQAVRKSRHSLRKSMATALP